MYSPLGIPHTTYTPPSTQSHYRYPIKHMNTHYSHLHMQSHSSHTWPHYIHTQPLTHNSTKYLPLHICLTTHKYPLITHTHKHPITHTTSHMYTTVLSTYNTHTHTPTQILFTCNPTAYMQTPYTCTPLHTAHYLHIYTCTQPIMHTLPQSHAHSPTQPSISAPHHTETSLCTDTHTPSTDMHTYTIHTQPTSDIHTSTCTYTYIFSPHAHTCSRTPLHTCTQIHKHIHKPHHLLFYHVDDNFLRTPSLIFTACFWLPILHIQISFLTIPTQTTFSNQADHFPFLQI